MATFSRRRWSSDNSEDLGDSHDVHVLAVDDSLIDRKVIERLLKITSRKVTAVDSGRRALQYLGLDEEKTSVGFNGMKVDMTITDYCMPGMTGYELLKKIKGSSTFKEVPVVIMSSENILARIDRCLEEGAEDFIVKPVKLSDVKRLKDYMFGEDKVVTQDRRTNKRKLQDMSCSDHSLSPPPPPSMPSESLLMPSLASLSTESLSSMPSLDSSSTWSPQLSAPSSPQSSPQLSAPSSPQLSAPSSAQSSPQLSAPSSPQSSPAPSSAQSSPQLSTPSSPAELSAPASPLSSPSSLKTLTGSSPAPSSAQSSPQLSTPSSPAELSAPASPLSSPSSLKTLTGFR